MFRDLQARMTSKSTPKIKESISLKNPLIIKSSTGKHVSPLALEEQLKGTDKEIQKQLRYSEKVEGFALQMLERMTTLESNLSQRLCDLDARCAKIETSAEDNSELTSDDSVRKQNFKRTIHLNRDIISKTV
ncbi:hypothetical protein TKK_0007971 [Trichogramma kaykai]